MANVQLEIQETSYEKDGKVLSPNCQIMPDSAHHARCTYASFYPHLISFFDLARHSVGYSSLQDPGDQASRNGPASLSNVEPLALVDSHGIVDFA